MGVWLLWVSLHPPGHATTENAGILTRVLRSLTLTYMLTLDRDRQIVLTVGRFGQLTTEHLASLHFHGITSRTPLDRALKRLVERRYLARIERRMVGGTGAGSGQYVYQLGSAGWTLVGRLGRYYPYRAINYHTLAIADAYIELLELERSGRIEIAGLLTEPDSWRTIAGVELRPDLYVEVYKHFPERTLALWLEVDMGTERPKQIKDKLAMYWHAYENSDETTMPPDSVVAFLSPDEERAKALRWIIGQGDPEAQRLFGAFTIANFAPILLG